MEVLLRRSEFTAVRSGDSTLRVVGQDGAGEQGSGDDQQRYLVQRGAVLVGDAPAGALDVVERPVNLRGSMMPDMMTQAIKSFAVELGADLVGVAPVERWNRAPVEHSPQGILPGARSVIVCGIHTPDACIELGAEEDPRKPGPALGELGASPHLQFLAFRLAKYLQDQGWAAIPISQSGYWSYRPREGAPRGWIADMSHYYAAAAAGLGEIGWHNICITPEYGTRQRFVSVITDAPLEPDPMYAGEPLCDRCLLCAKHCPTESFDKEVSGECVVEIGGRQFPQQESLALRHRGEFSDRRLSAMAG